MDKIEIIKKTRILILFPHLVAPGGALNYTLRLAEQLWEPGAAVAVLTLRADGKSVELPAGLEVISLAGPLTSSLAYWLLFPMWQARLNRAITAWEPDVLVPQVFPANWWGWLYRRSRPRVKLVWVCHEPSAFIHSAAWIRALTPWWKRMLARVLRPLLKSVDLALVRYCDRVIANSQFTAEQVRLVYGVVADGVASPGLDLASETGKTGQKERALLTVARLTRFKRIDFLLAVFQRLLQSDPDLIYHIVGTGEDEDFFRAEAVRLGIGKRVVFHGHLAGPALAGLYRKASLFLHGSIGEPFGMAPLEAIAGGTPVVAHDSGGPREFISEKCGRLIASLDVEDWAETISAYLDFLFSHPDFPAEVRECASNFDWRQTLRPAVKIIAELAGASGDNNLTIRSGKNRFAKQ